MSPQPHSQNVSIVKPGSDICVCFALFPKHLGPVLFSVPEIMKQHRVGHQDFPTPLSFETGSHRVVQAGLEPLVSLSALSSRVCAITHTDFLKREHAFHRNRTLLSLVCVFGLSQKVANGAAIILKKILVFMFSESIYNMLYFLVHFYQERDVEFPVGAQVSPVQRWLIAVSRRSLQLKDGTPKPCKSSENYLQGVCVCLYNICFLTSFKTAFLSNNNLTVHP